MFHKIKNIFHNINCFFFPYEKWIRKYIKYNQFENFDRILSDFMFGWVVEAVESNEIFKTYEFDFYDCPDDELEAAIINDKNLQHVFPMTKENVDDYIDDVIKHRNCKREILECVRYAHIRDKIKRHIEISDYEVAYKWELKLIELDKKYMHIIVKHHNMMVT